MVEKTVAGRDLDRGVDALLALEVLDHQTVVRFGNLKLEIKISFFSLWGLIQPDIEERLKIFLKISRIYIKGVILINLQILV